MALAPDLPTIGLITDETLGKGKVVVTTAGQVRSGPLAALRLGTRWERLHASHSYGFVLSLVFVSFAFTALMPGTTWSEAALVLIEASILAVALLTSGLPFGRYAVPLILLTGLVTAVTLAAADTSFTRSSAA